LASLKRLSKNLKLREPIALVFAYGANQAGLIERKTIAVINASEDESRYLDVSFERRTSIPPLQAADIVAYRRWFAGLRHSPTDTDAAAAYSFRPCI
jgi:hypothetical protein